MKSDFKIGFPPAETSISEQKLEAAPCAACPVLCREAAAPWGRFLCWCGRVEVQGNLSLGLQVLQKNL